VAGESLSEVLPYVASGLILVLYVLAICGNMTLIVPLSVIILLIMMLAAILMGSPGRKNLFSALKIYYLSGESIVIIAGLIIVGILTSAHVATWWDDINYWATDAKALFYLNAFPGKYGNVAPEFGDYPPAVQIMKWCMAKLHPSEYLEGLSYSGYYIMNVIFALPLLKRLKGKNIGVWVIGFLTVILLPGVCNDVWSHGACADVTMGIVYGALLISIADIKGHSAFFYYSRIAMYMSVLTLCKSVGFEWLFFAAVFLIVTSFTHTDTYVAEYGAKHRIYAALALMTGMLFQVSWWLFCLTNRRIAKLTSSGVHLASGGFSLPDNAKDKAGLFLSGLSFYPMHTGYGGVADMSSLVMLIVIAAVIAALMICKKLTKKEGSLLSLYALITGLITYAVIFIGHISIFAGESQYDTADVMAISISRYAAPYTIGMLMLLLYILSDRLDTYRVLIACAVFVLMTTDYGAVAYAFFGYRENRSEDLASGADMVDEKGVVFAATVRGDEELWGHRVLYFRDDTVIHWVKDTYINHEVAPVPVVYVGINPVNMDSIDIAAKISEMHASYIYMEDVAYLEGDRSIEEIMQPLMEEGSVFEYNRVYKVSGSLENGLILIAK